ncbi:MAG: ABC transporter substrate-binding protein [Cyanobacteria bacterium P01_G01_bin.54]
MKRRFLTRALTRAAIALPATPLALNPHKPAHSQAIGTDLPALQWRMATSWPKSLEIVFGTASRICQRVGELTEGQFTITPYAAGEIAPGLDVLQAVSNGDAECGHTAGYYAAQDNPAFAFATTLPFGLNTAQQNAWLYHGGGLDALHPLYTDVGVINFPAGSTGAQMGGWFNREVNTLSDLQGLKMRIPGLGGQVMQRLGVDVQVLPGGEIFAALENKTIDAAEWVGPYEDERLGLDRVAEFYYYPGWWEPGTTYELQLNLELWNQLPKTYQAAIRVAAAEVQVTMLAQYDSVNGAALEQLMTGGTQLRPFSLEILTAARQATDELLEEISSTDATFRDLYDQWQTFRRSVYQWNNANEFILSRFIAEQIG